RHRSGLGVEHEEHRVSLPDRRLGLRHHAAGQRLGARFFEARGVDDGEVEIAETSLALPPVAGDAGPVVDQRHAPPDQAVEQRGLADVRPPDNGDGEAHAHWCSAFTGHDKSNPRGMVSAAAADRERPIEIAQAAPALVAGGAELRLAAAWALASAVLWAFPRPPAAETAPARDSLPPVRAARPARHPARRPGTDPCDPREAVSWC